MKPEQKHLLEVQVCEQEIVKMDVDIKFRVGQLREASPPNERQLSQAANEIRDKIRNMEEKVNWLEMLAQSMRKGAERTEVCSQVDQHRKEIDHNGQVLRRATLTALQTLERESRQALFSQSSDDAAVRQRNLQTKNLRDQSSRATSKLGALVANMNDRVQESEQTLTTLVGSSNIIDETETEFGSMGASIQTSSKLLSKYSHRERTDRILLFLALCLFFGTAFYIAKKRLFPNGFW